MSIQQNFPAISPSLSLNFARSKTLDPRITFTRTSTATRVNGQGLIEVVGANQPRFDHSYDPVSGTVKSLGLLIEEQRVNSIRNNTMVGAVSGTSGTLPTYWSAITSTNGITREVIGTGTENGISYIDIKYSGTNTLGSNFYTDITFDTGTISASQGQTWTLSCYIKLISGVFSGSAFSSVPKLILYGAPSFNDNSVVSIGTITNQSLISQRFTTTKTYANATTTSASTRIGFTIATGATIDFTIRIGMPQLELGSFATSVIPTSGSTATRNPDNASMVGENFSSWYNQSEGTVYVSSRFYADGGAGQLIFQIDDDGNANKNGITFRNELSGNQIRPFDVNYSASPAGFDLWTHTGSVINTDYKTAFALKSNDMAAVTNYPEGSLGLDSSTSRILQEKTTLRLGSGISNISPLNGHISQLTYYPTRLTNAQLQNLTK